jgi:rhodanese-related sulfurtransferase
LIIRRGIEVQNKTVIVILAFLVLFVVFKSFNMTKNQGYEDITASEAKEMIKQKDVVVVDVRQSHEFESGHISGAKLIPLDQIKTDYEKLDSSKKIIAVCRSGRRSAKASNFLVQQGFDNVYNLNGGMIAWNKL